MIIKIAIIFLVTEIVICPMAMALESGGCRASPKTQVALLQSAEALTKCSAFFHLLSIGYFGTQNPDGYRRTSSLERETIIIAAQEVVMAAVQDSDPTTHFNEYVEALGATMETGGADWARGYMTQCQAEISRAKGVMADYVVGR